MKLIEKPPPGRLYVGIDIGKNKLSIAAGLLRLNVPNTSQGWERILTETQKLKRHRHFVCEASGHFGEGLLGFLYSRRKRVSVISPYRIRQFGNITGRLAKTDSIDAATIAEYGEIFHPPLTPKPREIEVRLRSLVRCRRQLVREQLVFENELTSVSYAPVRTSMREVIKKIEEQVTNLNSLTEAMIRSDACLAAKHEAFCEVKGIGAVLSRYILAGFPEIGRVSRKRAAALIGLAPYSDDSGESEGARHIWGGRKDVRASLYMPALSNLRCNPILKTFYYRLRSRGKPHRVAITAVMRKMLIYLNSIAAKVEREQASEQKTSKVLPEKVTQSRRNLPNHRS